MILCFYCGEGLVASLLVHGDCKRTHAPSQVLQYYNTSPQIKLDVLVAWPSGP